jgi:hypothetical protein
MYWYASGLRAETTREVRARVIGQPRTCYVHVSRVARNASIVAFCLTAARSVKNIGVAEWLRTWGFALSLLTATLWYTLSGTGPISRLKTSRA